LTIVRRLCRSKPFLNKINRMFPDLCDSDALYIIMVFLIEFET